MRGRKPNPTKSQINAGDPRKKGKRVLEEKLGLEPKPIRALPRCPAHLKGRARAAWMFWAEELESMGIDFGSPDAIMLEGACVGYAWAVDADVMITDEGVVIEEPIVDKKSGVIVGHTRKANPAVAISRSAWGQVRAFCSEFGLSPVSRTRLAVEKKSNAEQDFMKILAAPRDRHVDPTIN